MSREELIRLVVYLQERLEESGAARKADSRRMSEMSDKISELTELLRKSNEAMSAMAVQVSDLMRQLKTEKEESAKLRSEVKVGRRNRFVRKYQKGTRKSDDENHPTSHTDAEEDFDGTPESLPKNVDVDAGVNEDV